MTTTNGEKFGDYVSVAEAARMVGTTTEAMANLVRKGSFTRVVVAGRTLVLRSEVESFVPRSKGRPTKEMQTRTKPANKPFETANRGYAAKYISQTEAARIRGISKQAIANLISRGRLSSISIAGRILVIRSEVEAFVPQPRTGRPPKKKTTGMTPKPKKASK